ncbi:hypothetical protein P8452_63819 [Trifolium repens]|nr:hypothetical protein P8452_63819 [Trifolium repens]
MDTQSVEDNTVNVDVGEVIGNLNLGLACFSEKVSNLNIFVMTLETIECELEGLVLDEENIDMDCAIKGFEFDLLCGVLGSEVRDLGLFLDTLHAEISDAKGKVSFDIWQDRLVETEQSLKLSEETFYEIKEHSVRFQRILSSHKKEENGNVEEGGSVEEDGRNLDAKNMMNMQTSEQHRNILMMLEKSLASEMDLEKNFIESKKIEENLKQRIASLEDELIQTEEEATEVWERWFEADNAREILKGISNELLARHKLSQFNLVGLRRNESELKAQLETSKEELKSDKVCSLEKQLQETESQLANVKTSAENRANAAEAQCKILTETNEELNKELALLKDGGITSESIELLKRQLKECDLQLQDAVATAEASQEKQKMLYDTIEDMEHVIKDLKSKVLKAESHADSTEDKCIILSESNADLNEEVNFLRSKLECLERSLHQAEEAKMTTAKDIGKRTKFFKSLGTQLALERERVNKKLSSLVSENKILVAKLKQAYKDSSQVNANLSSDHEANRKKSSANDDEVKSDSMPDVETVRRIDAGVLTFKHALLSLFLLLLSAVMFLYFKDLNVDFSL